MDEENMMDDECTQDLWSESAFSGTSDDAGRPTTDLVPEIAESNVLFLIGLPKPLKATKYGHSFALLVPLRIIPSHAKSDILEVKVARASDPAREVPVYTRHLPGYKHAYLDLQSLAPVRSEVFWIRSVNLYSGEGFVIEYNSLKPRGLENTELVWEAGIIYLLVDGRKIALEGQRLRTYQGRVILDCQLGEAGQVKIAKGFGGFELRLKEHSPVTSITTTESGVILGYTRTSHDIRPHQRMVLRFKPDKKQAGSQGRVLIPGSIRIMPVSRKSSDMMDVVVDSQAREYVRAKLAATTSIKDYKRTKGGIAEEIVMRLTGDLGVDIVADHPTNKAWWKTGSDREGPDLLVRVVALGELCYLETKWWDDVDDAIERAEGQVTEDLRLNPSFKNRLVEGAFIAILDWKARSEMVRLVFRKVA